MPREARRAEPDAPRGHRFQAPLLLKGWAEPQPAGAYAVDIEEELIEGLSFPAYRGVSTMITRQAARAGALVQAIPVTPASWPRRRRRTARRAKAPRAVRVRRRRAPDPRSPATRGQEEVATQPDPTRASPRTDFAGYVSEHRFRLLLLLCALALALMLAAVYGTVGFAPFWARFDVPAA